MLLSSLCPVRHLSGLALLAVLSFRAPAAPVINELMFHPLSSIGSPEDRGKEWIELHNPDGAPADLSGWRLNRGVTFTIPNGTTIAAGGFLVIAADVAKFNAAYPGFSSTVIGGWTGTLANGGEQVQIVDTTGVTVDDVTYADEGAWAVRVRSALSFGHRGWEWEKLHDGGGHTLAKIVATGAAREGQNWKVSPAAGGTPGAANWTTLPPEAHTFAVNVRHKPEIPRSTDTIRIHAELPGGGITNRRCLWRVAGAATFNTAFFMEDQSGAGGGPSWQGTATIPAQANGTIIEYYVDPDVNNPDSVNDTVPRKARTSNPGVQPETRANVCNFLFQVDDSFDPARDFTVAANQPILRVVMTPADRAELEDLQTTSGEEDSEATFNCAFISQDGTGTKVVQNSGVRNRGQASALGPPNNFHISFRSDDKWNGRSTISLNCQYPYSQVLGNVLFARAGIAPQDAVVMQLRVNGADPAVSGSLMFGRYAMLEGRGAAWAEKHYPLDANGNFYRLDDHDTGGANPPGDLGSGEFRYEGTDPAAYSDTFLKETNKEENDFSDLINLTRIVSAPATGGTAEQPAISDAAYPAAVGAVLDVDHFYKYIATDALIGNQEGGLQSGRADDTSIYRGVTDPRFRFVPHDMDDVFDIGSGAGNPVTRSIWSYDEQEQQGNTGVVGLRRMFNHPALQPKYYAALLDGMNTWFDRATLDPVIDQIMQGWVPAGTGAASPARTVAAIKAYIDARRTNVLSQIQQNYSLTVTGNAADSVEGYKVSTNGAVTFSGTFNVARTYSITVNGVAATWFYRTQGADNAGTWRLNAPAGGGGVLKPGLNKVVVRFWDGPGGTGHVVQELLANVLWNAAAGTTVNGTLTAPGSLTLIAPESYIPGVPMLVRVDLKDGTGNLNRAAWNTTVNLTATNGVIVTPNTMTLTNGMGSALVTVGGGATTTQSLFTYGTGGNGSANSGTPGSQWRAKSDFTVTSLNAFITSSGTTWFTEGFDDSSWTTVRAQAGYGDGDENTPIPDLDYDPGTGGSQNVPCYLFRSTFTIADIATVASVTGQVKYDDAYRLYVNGAKVANSSGLGDAIALNQYATAAGENSTANFTVPLALLHNGVNTIAVQVHQDDATSSDMTFDLRMDANISTGAADPGNFTLGASAGSVGTSKALTSLGAATGTSVSGTLPAGVTNWNGVVRVTGDLTVPAGATLNIAPGTHVLLTGTSGAGSTTGTDIICTGGGVINAPGTLAQPISFTAHDASTRWGEINTGGSATTWNYCLISRAAHSPGGGHTGTGPAFRLSNGAVWTFDDGVIADLPGKTLTNTGNTTMIMRRSQFARCVMGPETDGSGITIEDCNFDAMLPAYRETGAADDEDNIYIHDSGGRPVNLRRSVFANCADDAIDLLGGTLTIEDCIVRNAFDKGISLLNNNITVRRTQIIDCDICVSTKCQTGSAESTPFLNTFENCTIVAENHPTNTSDGTFHSVGIHTRNKYGTTTMNITVDLRNCIVSAEEPVANDYGAGTFPLNVQNYTCFFDQGGVLPSNPLPSGGLGNLTVNPQFTNAAARNFMLAAGSPCINTGDPAAAWNDPDGSRNDMGALSTGATGGTPAGEIRWTLAGSPYRITANTTVPSGVTLRIDPGVNVQSAENVRLRVEGRILAEGTPGARIVFSHVPGTNSAGDVDPIKLGTQTGAPKWGGVRVYDSMSQENVFRYCDFINAQGTSPSTSENYGSLGFIRSWGWADHCTFAGTHLRMLYGRNSKLTFTYNIMPDMFIFDPVLNRIEEPTTDFIAAADNSMEPMKVEYPTTDAEVSGNADFPNGMPRNGHWRCYFNEYHGNRGHQDVFDCDSGRWSPRDPVTNNQSNGQFVIDCRYNHFYGLSGDEHMDLGGDAYIASNVFENAAKDYWTNDTGYSNAISSGDKGTGTTIMVVRNVCYDLDHVINLKASTATIFEHNTVANIHPDFVFQGETVTQNVICAPINFFVAGDGANPSVGDGAYMGFNIVSNVPHVFSGPDRNAAGTGITTKIEFFHNLLDQIADPVIGPNHPGGFFSGTYGPNTAGAPGFVNPAEEDYSLRMDSLARGTAPGGLSYGASIPEWAYITGGPSGTVSDTTANFTVGGPGLVAYKWRLDGGAWSAPVQIGNGGVLNRTGSNPRQAVLTLNGITAGPHTLEVIGQDMAGNWQDNDPARLYDGAPQFAPTARTWTVDATVPLIMLSEVQGDPQAATAPEQYVEIVNRSATFVDLTGWSLTDNPLTPGEQLLGIGIPAGNVMTIDLTAFSIDNDGDAIYLFDAANTLRDSIVFGPLPAGYSLGRVGSPATWQLCEPALSYGTVPNVPARLSDSSQIIINEWLVSGGIRYEDDWVELANLAPFPASLTGLILTDARYGQQVAFPPLSFIGGYGFVKLIADGDTNAGPNHLSFRMDGLTEELLLIAADGSELDNVRYFPQLQGVSQGRVATGGVGGYGFFTLPTAGAANGSSDPGYTNAVNVLNFLRITEIMYSASGGNDYEFVELTNTGGVALDLGGVDFYNGIDFIFPSGFTLAPGAEVVLVKNLAAFQNRYGMALNVAGQYTGNLDNSGEELALRLPSPFDANVLWFRYENTWYNTNATGFSLTLVSNAISIEDFGERDSWAASTQLYGTPDSWAPGTDPDLNIWLAGNGLTMADILLDTDFDGLTNALEFSLYTNPGNPSAPNGADRLPVAGRAGGYTTITFDLPATSLPGSHGTPGTTYEVQAGSSLTGWTTLARKTPGSADWTDAAGGALPAGTVTLSPLAGMTRVTVRDSVLVSAAARRYLRLNVTVVP
jgi:hypothetical protein